MSHIARGASLSGLSGRIIAEESHGDIIIKGEPDGIKLDPIEAARLGAFLTGGDAAVFELDEKLVQEAAEDSAETVDADEPEAPKAKKPSSLKPPAEK